MTPFPSRLAGRAAPHWGGPWRIGAALVLAALVPAASQAQPGLEPQTAQRLAAAAQYDAIQGAQFAPSLIPADFVPWWQGEVLRRHRVESTPYPLSLDDLVLRTLQHSLRIRVLTDTPLVQRTAIAEANARWDPQAFVESKYVNTNEPVGSVLTTGGPPRYRDSDWTYSAGVRRKTPTGGQLELAQRLGHRSNNSIYLQPPDQGTSRIALSFTQPLLNGAGRAYNQSVVVLAELDTATAEAVSRGELQSHLAEVTSAYWGLYLERANAALRARLSAEAERVLVELESRREIDASASQIIRARAATESRRAATVRAGMAVKNAEARLTALVNDPELGAVGSIELIPRDLPARDIPPPQMRDSLVLALESRPEIGAAFQQLRSSSVRLQVAERELLPFLALLVETYVAGLRGHSDIGQAWVDQFSQGQPSYTVGLTLDMPWGNRAAKARLEKQQIQRRQMLNQMRQTMEQVLAEVEIATRELATAHQEMQATYRALAASQEQLHSMEERWRLLPGDDRNASLYLEDLLEIQERLTAAEFAFLTAQLSYAGAWIEWKRATGTLWCQANGGHPMPGPSTPGNFGTPGTAAPGSTAPPPEAVPPGPAQRPGPPLPAPALPPPASVRMVPRPPAPYRTGSRMQPLPSTVR